VIQASFVKRKSGSIVCFVCGLFLCAVFVFWGLQGTTFEECIAGVTIGATICTCSIISFLFNHKAFLYIEAGRISAKYHCFGRIDCPLSDVDFVVARINTLIIQLKNGKRYTIGGIENSEALCSAIRQNLPFEATEGTEIQIEKLNDLKSSQKKGLIYVCFAVAFMFINILVTVFLTGERDLHEFSITDWIIAAVMGVIEIATIIASFYFAQQAGRNTVLIENLQYVLRRTVVETKPLLPTNILRVLADDDYTVRVTVVGYPNDGSVYYIVQEVNAEYGLMRAFRSDTFDSIEELPEGIQALRDITDKVLH